MSWWRTILQPWRLRGPARGDAAPGRKAAPAATTSPRRTAPDYVGPVVVRYAPHLDGDPDPGEVVWTWVPFEEDPSRGKDRPVLLVGHDGPWLLALMLTSKDHAGDGASRPGADSRRWLDIGTGAWDPQRRPSEVRLDRVLRVDPAHVRREGAVLPRAVFDQVTRSMTTVRG